GTEDRGNAEERKRGIRTKIRTGDEDGARTRTRDKKQKTSRGLVPRFRSFAFPRSSAISAISDRSPSPRGGDNSPRSNSFSPQKSVAGLTRRFTLNARLAFSADKLP